MILDWISKFPKFDGRWGIKLGLERMEELLEQLGNPHRQLRFVHVAGTNGKGSTCAYLASIYQAAGYRVGRYTSPYIMHFFDRMSINGVDVSEEQLARYAQQLKPHIDVISATEVGQPTEFEVITILAILFFVEQQVDIVVWETGLGGRLDATNVVTPLASVITNVGLDHLQHLGPTIEAIAKEKAGIIKADIPVVTAAVEPALSVIQSAAKSVGVPLFVLGTNFEYVRTRSSLEGQGFNFRSTNYQLKDLDTVMLGEHQCINAALAIQTVLHLSDRGVLSVSAEAVRRGIEDTRWPGRLEIVGRDPLVMLDGAHNPHGADALAAALKDLFEPQGLIIVVGILLDKLVPGVLDPILPYANSIVVTAPNTPRAARTEHVSAYISDRVQIPVVVVDGVANAVAYARKNTHSGEAVLVTGSLYTISEARQYTSRKG